MPRYDYEALDAATGEVTNGTVVCEDETDLATNLEILGLKLRRFRVTNPNANPEPPDHVEPTLADISHSPAALTNPLDPVPDKKPANPFPPDRPRPRHGDPAMHSPPAVQINSPFPPPQSMKVSDVETKYEDNGVQYMVKSGKLFKEDWIECDKARFRVIKVAKGGKRSNITEEVIIEKLDWKELSR